MLYKRLHALVQASSRKLSLRLECSEIFTSSQVVAQQAAAALAVHSCSRALQLHRLCAGAGSVELLALFLEDDPGCIVLSTGVRCPCSASDTDWAEYGLVWKLRAADRMMGVKRPAEVYGMPKDRHWPRALAV